MNRNMENSASGNNVDAGNKVKRSEKLLIQERDVLIFKFLNRVGYANLAQIATAMGDSSEKMQAAILRRLYLLRRFEYLKVFFTHLGNYYALARKAKLENELINSIKLDQIEHHNFLIDLFFVVKNLDNVLSEREAIAKFKVVGKKGKVPDMVINDWIIEYERTNKSMTDSTEVVNYWTSDQGKKLCVIYETEEIKNRYSTLINHRVKLLSRARYTEILQVIADQEMPMSADVSKQNSNDQNEDMYKADIRSKYL